jgi:hypothetical protein
MKTVLDIYDCICLVVAFTFIVKYMPMACAALDEIGKLGEAESKNNDQKD